jgi:putative membrane protein
MASEPYFWIKAIHIIAVVGWIASLLIYPRLLVYRLESQGVAATEALMDTAATRTRNMLMTPMMILTWLLGIALLGQQWQAFSGFGWIWAKVVLVLVLSGFHGYLVGLGRKIAAGQRPMESKRLRAINEIPFVIMILIVILVVVKPF